MKNLLPFTANISDQTNQQVLYIASAHIVCDKFSKPLYKKAFGKYPNAYKVTDEQIAEAKKELEKRKQAERSKKNTIFFVNMGMGFEAKPGYISNHRTRAHFINKYNEKCFIEVGTNCGIYSRKDNTQMRCDFSINETKKPGEYNYKNLVNIINNIENNNIQNKPLLEYTEKNLLNIINTYFDCDFEYIYFSDILTTDDIQRVNINKSPTPRYTSDDWTKDGTFKAAPYSEVSTDIFTHFLECLPPLYIKDKSKLSDCIELDIGSKPKSIMQAFQNSEPVSHERNNENKYVPMYATFAYINNKPLYLGAFPRI